MLRIGVIQEMVSNAEYRAVDPLRAMQRRGHTVAVWQDPSGRVDWNGLAGCDLIHVYRTYTEPVRRGLLQLARAGAAITYDNDDDLVATPRESPNYKQMGGLAGQRNFVNSLKVARLAQVVTTTSPVLAEKFRAAGIERVEVLDNHLSLDTPRPRVDHQGLVIGWVAALEHRADAARIDIAGALQRVLDRHAGVRVECIGVDLKLTGSRYRFDTVVPFVQLPRRLGSWDIAIAPLADIPYNRARSTIKLKEYAASGAVWLASPVGPYAPLGEQQGGRTVADDRWFEELDRLVRSRLVRWSLRRKGVAWAKRQTIAAVADRWESIFLSAVATRRG